MAFLFESIIIYVLLILQIFLQNWGDYTDMSQAVLIYVTYAGDVLLICWCGTQLTQHVRKMSYYYFFVGLVNTLYS
jgi:hypothetical protein